MTISLLQHFWFIYSIRARLKRLNNIHNNSHLPDVYCAPLDVQLLDWPVIWCEIWQRTNPIEIVVISPSYVDPPEITWTRLRWAPTLLATHTKVNIMVAMYLAVEPHSNQIEPYKYRYNQSIYNQQKNDFSFLQIFQNKKRQKLGRRQLTSPF